MRMWAEKEMLNLKRMRKFGIACPEVKGSMYYPPRRVHLNNSIGIVGWLSGRALGSQLLEPGFISGASGLS